MQMRRLVEPDVIGGGTQRGRRGADLFVYSKLYFCMAKMTVKSAA